MNVFPHSYVQLTSPVHCGAYQATPPMATPTPTPGTPNSTPGSSEVRKKRKYRSRIRARSPTTVERLKKHRRGKANDRERNRMHSLNGALETLRSTLPCSPEDAKMTKIETLKMALNYIALLQDLLHHPNPEELKNQSYSEMPNSNHPGFAGPSHRSPRSNDPGTIPVERQGPPVPTWSPHTPGTVAQSPQGLPSPPQMEQAASVPLPQVTESLILGHPDFLATQPMMPLSGGHSEFVSSVSQALQFFDQGDFSAGQPFGQSEYAYF